MQCIAPRIRRRVRGQAMVEMALVLPLLMLLMVGIIQLVLIGNVALSVSQAASACARYASLNPSATQSTVNTYLTKHRVAGDQRFGSGHANAHARAAADQRHFAYGDGLVQSEQ